MPLVTRSLAASATVLLFLALPGVVEGQSRAVVPRDTVPLGMLPPAGKCRIWMDGVPAAQQPAPTDCTTALRQRPANGTILYGPASRETGSGRFDPSVGDRARARSGTQSDSVEPGGSKLERGGSKAERELQRRRDEAERDKRAADSRERFEREQRDATSRVRLIESDAASRGRAPTPANSRTGDGTAKGSPKPPAEPAPKPPAAGPAKKKPE